MQYNTRKCNAMQNNMKEVKDKKSQQTNKQDIKMAKKV